MEGRWALGDFGKVLTRQAFEFYLAFQLKRAVRSQNFLTLLMLTGQREWGDVVVTGDAGMLQDVADVIRPELRTTDAMGRTGEGTLGVMLLDADYEQSRRVIRRLVVRVGSHSFRTLRRLVIGAASCPTHGADAKALGHEALSRVIVSWRADRPMSSPFES